MKEFERKQLLDRVEREGATVGASIPEEVTLEVDGETGLEGSGGDRVDEGGGERSFRLREFVFAVKRRDRVPPEERERVEAVKRSLRRERLARKQRLEQESLSFAAGERLVEEIVGLDRAIEALESLGPTDLEAEMEAQERADVQRWRSFLDRALGHDDGGGGPRGPGGGGRGRP